MPTTIPDLWPPEIFVPPAVTPIAILRQQVETLGSHTHNFVHFGDTETTSHDDGKQFIHTLYLVAPFLRYRQPLLKVATGLQAYPATVSEADLTKQGNQFLSAKVTNEQELQDWIRTFFNEPRVKEVVRAVIGMSNDVVPPENGTG